MSVLATFPTWWGKASSCVKSGGRCEPLQSLMCDRLS